MSKGPKQKRKEADNPFQLETEEHKPEKIDLGDTASLKRALDEAAIMAVQEAGHKMDNTYTDIKIVLGVLCCIVACVAYFYPKKHGENFWLLLGCIVTYVILSTLMTVIATVYEKDAITFTCAVPGGAPALAISSRLPRFQDLYTLRVQPRGAPAAASGNGSSDGGALSLSKSVGAYFDEDGLLAAGVIKKDVEQLLQQAVESKTK